ncbi:MAG: GNAT family N-acetyltransferase [Thermoplasmata archaeon]|nr:GNAT family N-acetyltransferase [Thermoplasmata archaeon]
MRLLKKSGNIVYLKLEEPAEIDKYSVPQYGVNKGFEFFRGLGVIDYARTFKSWLRKFPRPVFIAAVENNTVVGWVFIEEWENCAKDGGPVHVLRAIEVLPGYRNTKIGFRLLLLGLLFVVGYMITKPITPEARRFFKKYGFMEEAEFRRVPVDLSSHTGYLILPPFRRKMLLESMSAYFEV